MTDQDENEFMMMMVVQTCIAPPQSMLKQHAQRAKTP